MDKDKQTRKKLIDSAKKEFIEKGYMKASLRNICKDAGLTTGAMYFFFQDKEELFESIVGGPLLELENTIKAHFSMEAMMGENINSLTPQDLEDDYEAALSILSVLYRYKEESMSVTVKLGSSEYVFDIGRETVGVEEFVKNNLLTLDNNTMFIEEFAEVPIGGMYKTGEDGTVLTLTSGSNKIYITYIKQ